MKNYSKYAIITSIILILAAAFIAYIPMQPEYRYGSVMFIILFSLPSLYFLYTMQHKKALITFIALGIKAYVIESIGVATGYPYGSFEYSQYLGTLIFGLVPWTLPFAFVPLVLGTMYLAKRHFDTKWKIIGASTALLLLTDLVIDPGITAVGFWIWQNPGVYYDVPFTNFIGWIISGFIFSYIAWELLKNDLEKFQTAMITSLFFTVVFWTAVNLYLTQTIPALLGIAFTYYMLQQTKDQIAIYY